MARTRRRRSSAKRKQLDGAEAGSAPQTPKLSDLTQSLKIIDINRRTYKNCGVRLPFLFVLFAVFGMIFLLMILSISILGIFVFGAIFSAVVSQIWGPLGAIDRRNAAKVEVTKQLGLIATSLESLEREFSLVLAGVQRISKRGVVFSPTLIRLTQSNLHQIDDIGTWDFGPYQQTALLLSEGAGHLTHIHEHLSDQYWLRDAQQKSLSKDQIEDTVQTLGSNLTPVSTG